MHILLSLYMSHKMCTGSDELKALKAHLLNKIFRNKDSSLVCSSLRTKVIYLSTVGLLLHAAQALACLVGPAHLSWRLTAHVWSLYKLCGCNMVSLSPLWKASLLPIYHIGLVLIL